MFCDFDILYNHQIEMPHFFKGQGEGGGGSWGKVLSGTSTKRKYRSFPFYKILLILSFFSDSVKNWIASFVEGEGLPISASKEACIICPGTTLPFRSRFNGRLQKTPRNFYERGEEIKEYQTHETIYSQKENKSGGISSKCWEKGEIKRCGVGLV